MKSITAQNILVVLWLSLFLGLGIAQRCYAGDYYIYRDPNGGLVISNKQPPPDSKIIRQQTLPDEIDHQSRPEERDDSKSNGNGGGLQPSKK